MPTKFVTNPRRPAAKKSRVPMRRNYASASTATNYLRDLRPAQVAQMVREGSLAITHADIGNDYHTVTLFEDGAGENRMRVEAKWFVPGEEWYDLSLGLRDGKVDPATADLFLGPSDWDKREREEQTRAAAKRKGITIEASRHYFNNPRRRNPSDIVPGMRIGKWTVDEVRTHDVIVTRKADKKGDGDFPYRVEVTTLADLEHELAQHDAPRRKNPAPKYICTNDRYCPTPDTFSSISDFQAMCQAVFGVRVPLASIGGDTYVDERGEVVLRPASRRRNPSDIVPGMRIGKYTVEQVRENDVIVRDAGKRGDGDDMYRVAGTTRADITDMILDDVLFSLKENPPKGFRIAGPAVKTLVDGLRISKADAQKLKDMMDTGAPRILQTADKMMNGNGVERISGMGGGLMYVNMGDTYDTTLIYDYKTNRFVVSSWGDIVERQPRRFPD